MVRVWDYHTFRYIYSNEVVVWRRIPMKISNLSTFMHYIALLHIADYILCTHKYIHVMPKIFSRSPGSTQATHSCGLIKLIRVVRNKRPISTVSVETWKDGFDGAKWHGRYQINHTYIYMYIIYIYIHNYTDIRKWGLECLETISCFLLFPPIWRRRALARPLHPVTTQFGFNVCFLPLPVGVRDMVHVSEKYHTLVKSCARWGDGDGVG